MPSGTLLGYDVGLLLTSEDDSEAVFETIGRQFLTVVLVAHAI